jgi:hypothetical protein
LLVRTPYLRYFVRRSISRVLYLYGHLSAKPVARLLMRSTRRVGGQLQPLLSDLAPDGVYQADMSPYRRCALTAPFHRCRKRLCHFCGTFRRVAPPGRYPASCPAEPGLSSARHLTAAQRPPNPLTDNSTTERKGTAGRGKLERVMRMVMARASPGNLQRLWAVSRRT